MRQNLKFPPIERNAKTKLVNKQFYVPLDSYPYRVQLYNLEI